MQRVGFKIKQRIAQPFLFCRKEVFMRNVKKEKRVTKLKTSYVRLIATGFLLMILVGTCLLMLPCATRSGESTSFLDALFTATSAGCVTGLIVVDTYTHWSLFGQLVILGLIQIGGLGFITIGVYVAVLLKKRIGLWEREALNESVSSIHSSGAVRMTKRIMRVTLLIEGLGALLLMIRFIPRLGLWEGIYYGVFHGISAFCNAGFDLMGKFEPYSSLCLFQKDFLVNITIMFLIISGSLGFFVWEDLLKNRWKFKKYSLHTKLVITITLLLIFGGAALFYILEQNTVMRGMKEGEKILAAFFASVTPRTAGFNTVDIGAMSEPGKLITGILMFIGGSPGSTAGGVKTTTVAVMFLSTISMIRSSHGTNVYGRRLEEEAVRKASTVVTINLFLAISAIILILAIQPLDFMEVFLEVTSAVGTVGMSTGVTRQLTVIPKIILIVLMYCGRLGSLSFILVFAGKKKVPHIQNPKEKILVG